MVSTVGKYLIDLDTPTSEIMYIHENILRDDCNKMKTKKYHTVGILPKSNYKIFERDKIDTPYTDMHDHSPKHHIKIGMTTR